MRLNINYRCLSSLQNSSSTSVSYRLYLLYKITYE